MLPAFTVQIAVVVTGLFLLLGTMGEKFWIFDILTHFRWQYAALLLGCGTVLLAMKCRKSGGLAVLGGAFLFLSLLPWTGPSVATGETALKVVSFNVLKTNGHREAICEFLERENADIVVLSEVIDLWENELPRLRRSYPHVLSSSRKGLGDVVILSRYAFLSTDVEGFRKRRWTGAVVSVQGVSYRLVAAHASPPTSESNSRARNRQLLALAENVAGTPRTILCGDLNITPFSPWFARLLERSGLENSSRGAGFSPTWMSMLPLIAVQIDHVLFSSDLALISRRVGPSLGSDHSPLIVEIAAAGALPALTGR